MKNTNEYKYNICPGCKKPMDWDDSVSIVSLVTIQVLKSQ
jgi:hypothetical protein